VINPSAAGLFGTPADLMEAAKNLVQHNPNASLSILSNLSPTDAGILAALSGHTTLPVQAGTPWYQRGLEEAFGGQPAETMLQTLFPGQLGSPTHGGFGVYPTNPLNTELSRYFLLGGLTPRVFNRYQANYEAYNLSHPTGYQT